MVIFWKLEKYRLSAGSDHVGETDKRSGGEVTVVPQKGSFVPQDWGKGKNGPPVVQYGEGHPGGGGR